MNALRLVGLGLVCVVAVPLVWAVQPKAATPDRTLLRCEAVYMPARNTWVREVELVGKAGRLSELRIDGQAVYTFAVRDTTVFTSQDNERIQIDFAEGTWRSDFRGLASGQGPCEISG
ncbi:MAG: hypothetical protein WEK74_07145 [Hydrogenophaga sp.]